MLDHEYNSERTCLLEIVSAANAAETLNALACRALDALQALVPFQAGFLLGLPSKPGAPPVLAHTSHLSSAIQSELDTLQPSGDFSAALDPNPALEPLLAHVDAVLERHSITPPLYVRLTAGENGVGLVVLAGIAAEILRKWTIDPRREEFLAQVGMQLGIAVKRLLSQVPMRHDEPLVLEFLNQLFDGYWQTDEQGRIIQVNPAALDTLKRPEHEVLGKRIDELSDIDAEGLRELRAVLQRDGIVRDFRLRVRARDGEIRTIRQTVQLVRDARGTVTGHQGIFRDITERERALAKLEQRNRQVSLLHELATRLNNTISKQDALRTAVELIIQLTGTDAIGIVLIDELEGHYDLVAHRGLEPELQAFYQSTPFDRAVYQPGFDPETTWNLIEYSIATRRILTTEDFQAMPRFDVTPILALGYQSLLTFPMRFDRTVYGVVMVGSKKPQHFDTHAIQLVESISAQLGVTLHNHQLMEDWQRQVKQMQAVVQTGRMLQYAPRVETGLPGVVRQICSALHASYAVIQLLRGNYFEYITASDTRESKRRFEIVGYERRLLGSPEPLILSDCDTPGVDPEHRVILEGLGMRAGIGLRLYAHDRPLGLLFVNQDKPRLWQPHETQLVFAFAQQIAYALENKRLLDEVNQQLGELQALSNAARLIANAERPDQALYTIAEEISRVFPADYVSFHLRQDNMLRLVAESKNLNAPRLLPILPHQLYILEELAPLCVSDARLPTVSPLQREALYRYNLVADMGIPLISGQKALGILYICQHTPYEWTDANVQLAETFAQQVASALTQARLLHETEGQVRDLRALARSATLIAHSRSPEHALPQAAGDLRRLLQVDYVGFHLLKGNHFYVLTESHYDWHDAKFPILPHHRPTIEHFQKIVTEDRDRDARSEEHRAILAEYGFVADVGVPLVARGKIQGILYVSQKTPRRWKTSEIQLVETFAQQIATVLENVELLNEKEQRVRELAQLAKLNELTANVLDEDSLEDIALNELPFLLGAARVALYLVRDGVVLPARSSDGVVYPVQPPPRSSVIEQLFQTKAPFIIDALHTPEIPADLAERMKFHRGRALLSVPLATAEESIGILSVIFQQEHTFTESEIKLAQSAANQLAVAFINARWMREQKSRIERLNELADFSLWCGTLRDSHTLQHAGAEYIRKMLRVEGASVRLVADNKLTIGAGAGYTKPEERDHVININPRLARVLNYQKPYPIENLRTEPGVPEHWRERHLQEGFQSLLMVPMLAEHKVVGILTVFRKRLYHWTESEIQYAQTVANTLALALSNVQQIETTQHHSDELRATLDSVFSGVFTTNQEGVIQSWTDTAEQITGYTAAEMNGKKWHEAGARMGEQRRPDPIVLAAMTENKVQFGYAPRFLTHADGREIQLRVAAAPLRDANGNVRGAVCSFWDRTQEQAAERVKVDSISLLGHQLGGKLASLLWSAEQLSKNDLSDASRAKHLALLAETRQDLEEFNRRFTTIQREHGQGRAEANELDLHAFVRKKLATWRKTHVEHRFRLRGEFDRVLADSINLDVVLENLLENACKYSPDKSLVTVKASLPEQAKLVLEIHNKGEPIPPDLRLRLFERYARGDTDKPGNGLGLWLVRTKLDEMGGDIRVVSDTRGTRFIVTLRRANLASPGLTAPPDAPQISQGGET